MSRHNFAVVCICAGLLTVPAFAHARGKHAALTSSQQLAKKNALIADLRDQVHYLTGEVEVLRTRLGITREGDESKTPLSISTGQGSVFVSVTPDNALSASLVRAAKVKVALFGSANVNEVPPLGSEHVRYINSAAPGEDPNYLKQSCVSATILDYNIEKTQSLTSPLVGTVHYRVALNETEWFPDKASASSAPFSHINKALYKQIFAYQSGQWIIKSEMYDDSETAQQISILQSRVESEKIVNRRYVEEHGNPPDGDPNKRNPHFDNILLWDKQLIEMEKENLNSVLGSAAL